MSPVWFLRLSDETSTDLHVILTGLGLGLNPEVAQAPEIVK